MISFSFYNLLTFTWGGQKVNEWICRQRRRTRFGFGFWKSQDVCRNNGYRRYATNSFQSCCNNSYVKYIESLFQTILQYRNKFSGLEWVSLYELFTRNLVQFFETMENKIRQRNIRFYCLFTSPKQSNGNLFRLISNLNYPLLVR